MIVFCLCLCDFALLCGGLSAAVGVNFNYLIACLSLSLCLWFGICLCVSVNFNYLIVSSCV